MAAFSFFSFLCRGNQITLVRVYLGKEREKRISLREKTTKHDRISQNKGFTKDYGHLTFPSFSLKDKRVQNLALKLTKMSQNWTEMKNINKADFTVILGCSLCYPLMLFFSLRSFLYSYVRSLMVQWVKT